MGAAFCVKNIAEAECATREHVSARKRACPKLLVVGRSLCSALVPKSWPSADRGGPSRGFGFCYRLWTSFWGAESGSSFGRRLKFWKAAGRLFSGVGLRARLVGWQVGLIGCGRSVGRSVDGLAAWLVGRLRLACWLKAWFLGAASRVFEA